MKLLLDMDLSPRLVSLLTAEEFEAMHCSAVGPAPAGDIDIVTYARVQEPASARTRKRLLRPWSDRVSQQSLM